MYWVVSYCTHCGIDALWYMRWLVMICVVLYGTHYVRDAVWCMCCIILYTLWHRCSGIHGMTSAHWASTGGQVAYFKIKILFFFSISLVLSFSLILHVKSSLTLKKLHLVKHIQQELSLALKKATLVCCSVSALCGTQFSVLWLFFPLEFIYTKI